MTTRLFIDTFDIVDSPAMYVLYSTYSIPKIKLYISFVRGTEQEERRKPNKSYQSIRGGGIIPPDDRNGMAKSHDYILYRICKGETPEGLYSGPPD